MGCAEILIGICQVRKEHLCSSSIGELSPIANINLSKVCIEVSRILSLGI